MCLAETNRTSELNKIISRFFSAEGESMSPEEWKRLYKRPTSNIKEFGDFSAATK